MTTKTQIIGASHPPMFKVGVMLQILSNGIFYFEPGSFKICRFSQKLVNDSATAGSMVLFDSPIDFPGEPHDAERTIKDDAPFGLKDGLFYISDDLRNEILTEYGERFDDLWNILSKTHRHQNCYSYCLLFDEEQRAAYESFFCLYEELAQQKFKRELLKANLHKENLSTFLLNTDNAKFKQAFMDDYSALLGIASKPDNIARILPYFLLFDGKNTWTEEDWDGLFYWAEEYGRRAGLGSELNAKRWEKERKTLLDKYDKFVRESV